MAGYTPVFSSLFQGSLCGQFPDLYVWMVMLGLADKNGDVDCHPKYLATVSGLPQADIEAVIHRLCQPDPSSRTPDEEGRRLRPLDSRGFGWRIVNHGKYREKARKAAFDAARVEDGRNAQRMAARRPAMTRDDPRIPDSTRDNPPSDSNANTDSNKKTKSLEPRATRSAATRLSEDFGMTPERKRVCEEEGLDPTRTLAKFRDYWLAASGAKARKTDWDATWRNWCRNEADRRPAYVNGHKEAAPVITWRPPPDEEVQP